MLSNFTIKQALPRLVIAAIAINLSFVLCALLVDASNLLGMSIYNILKGVSGDMVITGVKIIELVDGILSKSLSSTTTIAGGATVAAFIAGVGPELMLGVILMFLSVLLGIALAIFIALLTLAARQAIIIILIVLAPIAFALYVLPGTKPLFDKWRKLMTTMLVFFPLFGILYGGATLAASILFSVSSGMDSPEQSTQGTILFLTGLVAQAVPLAATFLLLKNGTGFIGRGLEGLKQKVKPLTAMPGRAGRKKAGEALGTTAMAARAGVGNWAARKRGSRIGRFVDKMANRKAKYEAIRKGYESDIKRQGSEYIETDARAIAAHERAGTNEELTKASEARLEKGRLNTEAGTAARISKTNAESQVKSRENAIEAGRLKDPRYSNIVDDQHISEENLAGAQAGAKTRALSTPRGEVARKNKTNAEGLLKARENVVEKARLKSKEGKAVVAAIDRSEYQRAEAEDAAKKEVLEDLSTGVAVARIGRTKAADELKTAENTTDTAGLTVESVAQAREEHINSEKRLKKQELAVEDHRLHSDAGAKVEHDLSAMEDTVKATELKVKRDGLLTNTGAVARTNLRVAEAEHKGTEDRLKARGDRGQVIDPLTGRAIQVAESLMEATNAAEDAKTAELDIETARLGDAEGQASVEALKTAEINKTIKDNDISKKHVQGNRLLYTQQAASKAGLDVTNARQEQFVAELKTQTGNDRFLSPTITDAAGNTIPNPDYIPDPTGDLIPAGQAIMAAAQDQSDIQKATDGAKRVFTSEDAAAILADDEKASRAGGIDNFGKQRALAIAENTQEQQLDEGRKIEQSRLGSIDDATLLQRATTGIEMMEIGGIETPVPLSTEAQMAVASEISKRGYAQNQIDLFRELNKQMAEKAEPYYTEARSSIQRSEYPAGAEGDKDYYNAVESYVDNKLTHDTSLTPLRFMQKQVMADIGSNIPFAAGDTMRGQWGRGVGRIDFDKEWAKRLTVAGKLSAPAMQKMKTEDMDWIRANLKPGGYLNNSEISLDTTKQELQKAVNDFLVSPDTIANTKPEIKAFFDSLRAQGILTTSFDNHLSP